MSIIKDLFIEEYEKITADAEDMGIPMSDDTACKLAHARSVDRFADMCDDAKDRAKYL
jgi:hypothetical protein